MRLLTLKLLLITWAALFFSSSLLGQDYSGAAQEYVGSDKCITCHKEQATLWKQSHHYQSMLVASQLTVLGDFNNQTLKFHNFTYRPYQKDQKFYISLPNQEGENKDYQIEYTFGYHPLQQYLVNIGNGRYQALNIAWDSRPATEGGQRWFHLQAHEDISITHPFFWHGTFANWNARCAECHSTNFQKNYNPKTDGYTSQWSDINVACEACHGPGSQHINVINKPFKTSEGNKQPNNNEAAYYSKKIASNTEMIDMCGGCHSRRQQIKDLTRPGNYYDKHRLQLLDENMYFPDGQIQDEVFVLGSFLQSKMHAAGVSCLDCHNPHSGQLKAEPRKLCTQCHSEKSVDNKAHRLHAAQTVECIDCHMPERTFMVIDARRDHRFHIPNPALARKHNVPLACDNCHNEKPKSWAISALDLSNTSQWPGIMASARDRDRSSIHLVKALRSQQTLAPIIDASLLESISQFPEQAVYDEAITALKSASPLVRAAAVRSLWFLDNATKWQHFSTLLDDTAHSVRFEIAAALAGYNPVKATNQKQLQQLITDYQQALLLTQDMPETQLALAELALKLGNNEAAELAYKTAIKQAPAYIPALLNYSDFLRTSGNVNLEKRYLLQALNVAPDNPTTQHAMGLFLIRQKNYRKALGYLKKAAENPTNESSPRFSFIYAVALDHQHQTNKAIDHLIQANERWPGQQEILRTLAAYLQKMKRHQEALIYSKQL